MRRCFCKEDDDDDDEANLLLKLLSSTFFSSELGFDQLFTLSHHHSSRLLIKSLSSFFLVLCLCLSTLGLVDMEGGSWLRRHEIESRLDNFTFYLPTLSCSIFSISVSLPMSVHLIILPSWYISQTYLSLSISSFPSQFMQHSNFCFYLLIIGLTQQT